MSKFKQYFPLTRKQYKLDEKHNRLKLLEEEIDMQAEMNSHYDETLFYNLERYFEASKVTVVDGVDEVDEVIEISGTKADRMLTALEKVMQLRSKYQIPDTLDDMEVLRYLRSKAFGSISTETKEPIEGGDPNETQTSDSQS